MTLEGYRDIQLLHEGARTSILRARASEGPVVVLKRLRAASPSPRELLRLRREYDFARAAAGLGVPAMLGLHARNGANWLEMESCPGESLGAYRERTRLDARAALVIARGLLDILERIHAADVVHCDLNPSNIVLEPSSGRLWIVDFGIARTTQPYLPSRADRIEGTPGYMAPEQTGRMNRAIGVGADYYALGATLYHLLTGGPPFVDADPGAVIYAQVARQPVPPRERDPAIPEAISDLVMTLLAKDADGRYQSAAGLRADLVACIARLDQGGELPPLSLRRADRSEALRIPDRLYGREGELAALDAAVTRVTEGLGDAIFIAGGAGTGKTSLVGEALRGGGHGALLASGKFEQFQRDIPYSAVIDALRQLVQQVLAESPSRVEAWRRRLGRAMGQTGGVVTEVLPELELLVGRQPQPAEVSAVDGEHRFRNSLVRVIRALPAEGSAVVLCLDDLQWADLASIALLEQLLVEPALPGILLVGTWRSNEVDGTHPLTRALERAASLGAEPRVVRLGPLTCGDVQALVADTLARRPDDVFPLAELVHAWTGGNPFLVHRVVEGLRDDGLLRLQGGTWSWSVAEIRQRGLGDDAARYVAARVDELPPRVRRALEVASCIGTRFRLSVLAKALGQTPGDVGKDLAPALALRLLHALDEEWWPEAGDGVDVELAFAHDRIQEAARGRLAHEDAVAIHLRVGRALADRSDADLFDVVHHLNLALPLLTSEERAALLVRDAEAGRRAIRSGAFGPALAFLDRAAALLPADAWDTAPEPTRALVLDAARAASLAGESARMDAHLEAALAHATSPLHRVAALEIRALDKAGRDVFGAIDVALAGLAELGLVVPREPTMADVGAAMGAAMAALGRRGADGVVALPELDDPTTVAAVGLANAIMAPAYVAVPLLLPILAAEIMRMTIERGVTPPATYGYAVMALVLTGTGALEPGHDLGELCLRLLERFHDRGHDVRPGHVLMGMVLPHTLPLREAVAKHRAFLPRALAAGDHEYVAWIAHLSLANAFYAGTPLAELAVDLERETRAMRRLGQETPLVCTDPARRLVRALRGEGPRPDRLDDGTRTEEEELAQLVASGSRGAAFVLTTLRVFQRFLFRDFEGAVAAADAGEAYVDGVMSTYHPLVLAQILALTLAELASRAPTAEARAALLERARKNRALLEPHVAYAPHNHRHRVRLIDAELARVEGDVLAAIDAYDDAIQAARDNGFVHDEALAGELAARFYLSRGKVTSARAYLLDACGAWARWGATAKLRRLEEELPELVRPGAGPERPITIDVTGDEVDLAAVWESTLAITREMRADRVVDRVLTVSMQNAGATRGLLLLERDGELWLEAGRGEGVSPAGTALRELRGVPASILQHVARAGERLLLADARTDARFASDPAIRADQPLSVLALPLVIGGRASGLIYLENDLVPGAFSQTRVQILEMLGTQAAISIANGRLYNELEAYSRTLEDQVRERTQAAERAQQAAESASSAKSAFLASMSHELRTPMNAIIGFTRIVQRRSGDALPVKQRENLEKVLVSSNHLLALINDVLDLSKIEAGRMELRTADFALMPLATECLHITEPLAEARSLTLKLEAPGLPGVVADADKVREILLNLLGNAVKFTKEGGSVTVRCYTEGAFACVDVADTGIGIPASALEDVFVEFWQARGGTSRQSGGTGLGLAISRKLARIMGGDVTVASEHGRGSTFTLRLPLGRAAHVAPPPSSPSVDRAVVPPAFTRASGRRVVLAIDDDLDAIDILRQSLRETGVSVVGASTGEEGIREARAQTPIAIFLDVRMPGTDGWQVLHRLKADPVTREIPVVMCTIVDDTGLGRKLGAAGWLTKPTSAEAAAATLARVCGRPGRVLIVDDDRAMMEAMRQQLEGEPYEIFSAFDGKEALAILERQWIDAVVLDLVMPNVDGFEVLDAVKRDPNTAAIPVIIVTAKDLSPEDERRLEKGVTVLGKSGLAAERLVAELRIALRSRAAGTA